MDARIGLEAKGQDVPKLRLGTKRKVFVGCVSRTICGISESKAFNWCVKRTLKTAEN